MIVALMFLGLVALILLNVPIAVALGLVAMGGMVYSSGFDSFAVHRLRSPPGQPTDELRH